MGVLRYAGLLLLLGIGAIAIGRTYLQARSWDEQTEASERVLSEGGEPMRWPDPAELEKRAANCKAGGRYEGAQTLYERALAICTFRKAETDDKVLAAIMSGLADVYVVQGRHGEADRLYRAALDICQARPQDHEQLPELLEGYASFLRKVGRQEEATIFEARAEAVRQMRDGNRPAE